MGLGVGGGGSRGRVGLGVVVAEACRATARDVHVRAWWFGGQTAEVGVGWGARVASSRASVVLGQ